jgi:hypothetical protein
VVEPLIRHPAADRVTSEVLVVEQDRSVVPMSTWIVDAATTAANSDRVLQLLTPGYSRLTYPLELLLRDTNADWVVREGPESFRDGLAGFVLRWNGARFAPDLEVQPATPVNPEPGSGDLELQLSIVHAAREELELGAATEAAVRAVTGADPTGWGVAEPVSQPWSRREVTAHCRERVPKPTNLLVVGRGTVGRLSVQRTDTGVVERVRLCGPPAGTVQQDAIESLVTEVADNARSFIVAAHPGRLHALRSSAPTLPALPYGILIGHSMVAERGLDHARRAPAEVRLVGTAPRQSVWCRLDRGPSRPYEDLHAVLSHFGMPDPT